MNGPRPVFTFGATIFSPALACPMWTPRDEAVGSTRWTAAGTPGPDLSVRFSLVSVPLRIWESEWPALRALIEWGQSAESFSWQPDETQIEVFEVYLEEPAAGAAWQASRLASFSRVMELTITLRGAGVGVPWLPYFGRP
jgi:hypothetical protein